ncbi:MAG: hypothetical protein QOJ35_4111 [Solirubrobacteraceae bacterium]|nr:hypothetical protein [Solirubrobacteraceae bacterium]
MSPFFEQFEQQLRAAAEQQVRDGRPVRWWASRRNVGLLAVLAVGLATPAVARVSGFWDPGVKAPPPAQTATVSSSASTTCSSEPSTAGASPNARLDPKLVRQLAVLRRPQTGDDALPRAWRSGPPGQARLQRSVRYVGSVAGHRYFVVVVVSSLPRGCSSPSASPARTQLCLLQDGRGGGCGIGAAYFAAHGMQGSSGRSDGRSVVVGLVPDGVASVTVRYGSSERSFDVRDNFYGYPIAVSPERSPDAITWTLRNGERREAR